jgi:hypothetical protein
VVPKVARKLCPQTKGLHHLHHLHHLIEVGVCGSGRPLYIFAARPQKMVQVVQAIVTPSQMARPPLRKVAQVVQLARWQAYGAYIFAYNRCHLLAKQPVIGLAFGCWPHYVASQ